MSQLKKNHHLLTAFAGSTAISGPVFIKKEGSTDDKIKNDALERLTTELSDARTMLEKSSKEYTESAKIVKTLQEDANKRGEVDGELQAAMKKNTDDLAEAMAVFQASQAAIDSIQKNMDSPLYKGGSDLADNDRKMAVELQRRKHVYKGLDLVDFRADMDNLVNLEDVRSAATKLMEVGLESKASIVRSFSEGERKAFEAAGLDATMLPPEMLGIEVDCEIECASLLDLYDSVSVSRSTFMYPHVESYGDIGKYDCDAKCDAEYGPEGNITWKNGNTYDYRGVFCFQRDTLRESNYDLLGFMMRAAARSYRINRNNALIMGDGINEPLGWLTGDCFTKVGTPNGNPNHVDLRQFLASAPMEYGGPLVSTMHQNTFAYFASQTDTNGRFIFGDGLMGYAPSDVAENIRISNCLPDPTDGGTKGDRANPFTAGEFIMATGIWKEAYAAVNQRPMFMEQYEGGSTAWCVKYQFGAKDGGFIKCCPAARTLVAGATPAPAP